MMKVLIWAVGILTTITIVLALILMVLVVLGKVHTISPAHADGLPNLRQAVLYCAGMASDITRDKTSPDTQKWTHYQTELTNFLNRHSPSEAEKPYDGSFWDAGVQDSQLLRTESPSGEHSGFYWSAVDEKQTCADVINLISPE